MIRFHRTLRVAALILLMVSAAGCDIGSSLEPETSEPAPKPPRTAKPKVLTAIGTRTPETLR